MVMHEGLKDFYHRQRVCCRCGKIFRIPPIGRYPYIMRRGIPLTMHSILKCIDDFAKEGQNG